VSEPDDELGAAIEAARAGNPRGFETLFRAFGASVAGYLRAHSTSDPDGLANDVFLRAFRTIATFQGDAAGFRSWLFTIAHHAAVDDARRRKRRVKEVPLERAPDETGGDVEAEVLANLAHERVHALLSALSPDQRDVLLLRIVADLSVSDTAEILGKSFEAVKALQHRALGALRRSISSRGAVPG
jgi:RNA polymerase sigma-70 factor (ECF subfamily)